MAKFNVKKSKPSAATTNLAGGMAYTQSAKLELVSLVLTSLLKDQYYRPAQDSINRLRELLAKVDPMFAAKVAIYARTVFGLRSITHVMAAELAKYLTAQPYARSFYEKVIFRVDDMLEIAAYHFSQGNKRLSSAMQFGFRKAIEKFDEYQLAKYRGTKSAVSLVDLIRLVRPASTAPNIEAIGKLVRGELKSTETWEAKLTVAGQSASNDDEKMEMKADAWKDLISRRKIGYFALVRNLRNIMAQAPSMIGAACEMLVDPVLVKKSKLFPFSFLTAMNEIDSTSADGRKIIEALSKAFLLSVDNIPELPNTLVVIDNSGSMQSGSYFGSLNYAQVAAMFGILLAKRSNADIMEFGERARYIGYTNDTDVFKFSREFPQNNKVGHSTNLHAAFKMANRKYDRIVVFSDMQSYGFGGTTGALDAYRQKHNANPYVYSIDLAGYGTMQFPENSVFAIAGFSEKIFDFIGNAETDPNVVMNTIEETVSL